MFARTVILLVLAASAVFGQDENVKHTFTCVSGETSSPVSCESSGADEAAAKAAAKCHSPKSEVANNTYLDYGCGACPDDKADSCVTCDAWAAGKDASECNTYSAPLIAFTCHVKGVATACTAAPTVTCFGASKTYTGKDATLIAGGCGTCAAAETAAPEDETWTAADCTDCTYENCNSGAALVAVLAPLFAAMWALSA